MITDRLVISVWEPFSKAPKNGTCILATDDDGHYEIISWEKGWDENGRSAWVGDDYEREVAWKPKYWIHLPDDPALIKKKRKTI
jgi:hypothetical protein